MAWSVIRRLQGEYAHEDFADCHVEGRAELQVESWAFSAGTVESGCLGPWCPVHIWGPGMPVSSQKLQRAPRSLSGMLLRYDFSFVDFIHLFHDFSPLSFWQPMFSLKACVDSKPLGKKIFLTSWFPCRKARLWQRSKMKSHWKVTEILHGHGQKQN